jgi:nucleoside 2-deoxyribosyltransferase
MSLELLDPSKVYYLASPYSHQKEEIRVQRFEQVNKFAVYLLKKGIHVIEPIVTGHVKVQYNLPTHFEFWKERDIKFIDYSDALIVYMIPGWNESKGVAHEIEYALKTGKPVHYIDYSEEYEKL